MAFLTRVLAQLTPPIMLIQDGATSHTALAMQRFCALHTERLLVFPLPSRCKELSKVTREFFSVVSGVLRKQFRRECVILTWFLTQRA